MVTLIYCYGIAALIFDEKILIYHWKAIEFCVDRAFIFIIIPYLEPAVF